MQHVNHLSKLSTRDGNILMEKFRLLSELLLNKNLMKVALNPVPETQDQLVRGAENFTSALSVTCSPLTCFKEEQFRLFLF